jgi:hypothetical protein
VAVELLHTDYAVDTDDTKTWMLNRETLVSSVSSVWSV